MQSGDEEGSACVKFGDLTVGEDPELQLSSGDIVMWSGLSTEEQLNFKPWKLVGTGKYPLVLGRTWVSDMLSTLEAKGKFTDEEYAECIQKQPDYLGNDGDVPEDPSDYCKDPCRWHRDMIIKPWEGMSQALVKSFYNVSSDEDPTHRNEVYVLLNRFREDSVFAKTELLTFLKQEVQKSLNSNYLHKAGTLDIRLRSSAYAKKSAEMFDPSKMLKVNGVVHYKATCKDIVKFVLDEQEKELQTVAFTGYKLVCVKCYEGCGGDFRTQEEGEDNIGTCTPVLSDGCSFVKEEL